VPGSPAIDGRIRAWRDYFDLQMFLGSPPA
jgi:limonene-1,2-epoxide hydrolase